MKNSQTTGHPLKDWAGVLGFIWFVVVVGVYYVSHKPLTPEIALNLVGTVWHIIIAIFIWCLAGGVGHRLIGERSISPLENFALQTSLGLGFLGIAWLLVGLTLGFGVVQGAIIGLLLLVVLFKHIRAWASLLMELGSGWKSSGRFGKLLGGEIFIILLATLATAAAPPVQFDALVYHLRLPQLYLEYGRFFYVPEIMFWGMPQIGEMLFTWSISLGGDATAALLAWLSGVTALIGLFGLLRERLGLPAAWSGLAALLAGFTLASSLSWAYVDWFAILFGTAFLVGMQAWLKQKNSQTLGIAGVMAGLALSTKYTAGILVLSGMVLIGWDAFRRRQLPQGVRSLTLFGAVVLLTFSPWLIKNAYYTGSPIYPFLFPAGAMDTIRLNLYQGGTAWGNWLDTLFLPWRATTIGMEAAPGYSASIGPLLLGLIVWTGFGLGHYSSEKRKFLKNTVVIVLPAVLLWMVLGRFSSYLLQSRLYLAVFPAIAVLAGGGYQAFYRLRISSVRLGRISGILIIFVLGLTAFEVGTTAIRQGSGSYLLGLEDSQNYRLQNLGTYALAMDQVNNLPADSRVLFLWETRSLGCERYCDPDEVLDRWPHDLLVDGTPEAVLARWQDQGFTHILYYQLGADFLQQEDLRFKDVDWGSLEMLKSSLDKIAAVNGYDLYKIR